MLEKPSLGDLLTPTARTPPRAVACDLALLALLVLGVYFVRLAELPVMGEEGRRARGAVNMIESGDWIVLKQQGIVFPDRPPMTNWLIAAGAELRGSADVVAIRLPSAVAVLLTTLLLYWVCVKVDTRLTAMAAAAIFATFAQVLQLGRLGESEAAFTLFVAGSLLVWHLAFSRAKPPVAAWVPGYALAAFGALTKGLQAPVYFVSVTVLFLVLRRQWRWLFGWGHWAGIATFLAIVGAWQIPYYRTAGLENSLETWLGVVGPRITLAGLIEHVAGYPFETLGCLALWSLLAVALLDRDLRAHLADHHPQFVFVALALAVTYPTVWLSAGAKGRYYMPLYPFAALMLGMIVDGLASARPPSLACRIRRTLAWTAGGLALLLAGALVAGSFVELHPALRQPWGWTAGTLVLAAAATWTARDALRSPGSATSRRLVLTLAAVFGLLHATVWFEAFRATRVDIVPAVRALRAELADPGRLVSFGPIDSRFLYGYERLVPELPWPDTLADVPDGLEVFAIDLRKSDTPTARRNWRGMHWWFTRGTLPFRWREIGRVSVRGRAVDEAWIYVVVGTPLRDAEGALIRASRPFFDRAGSGTGEPDGADSSAAPPG